MLDIICTRKEKIRVFLFFELYKLVLIIIQSENCSYTGDLPIKESRLGGNNGCPFFAATSHPIQSLPPRLPPTFQNSDSLAFHQAPIPPFFPGRHDPKTTEAARIVHVHHPPPIMSIIQWHRPTGKRCPFPSIPHISFNFIN